MKYLDLKYSHLRPGLEPGDTVMPAVVYGEDPELQESATRVDCGASRLSVGHRYDHSADFASNDSIRRSDGCTPGPSNSPR
jgi:hypothetical protein